MLFSIIKTIYDNFVNFQIKKTTGNDVVAWEICYDKDNSTLKSLKVQWGSKFPIKTAITATRPESHSKYFLNKAFLSNVSAMFDRDNDSTPLTNHSHFIWNLSNFALENNFSGLGFLNF